MSNNNHIKVIGFALAGGTPPTTIDNCLEISEEAELVVTPEMNDQNDVAGRTFSNRSGIAGKRPASGTIPFNLKSTDGVNEPAVDPVLKMCGMVSVGTERVTMSDVGSLSEGDVVTGDISNATATVGVINGTEFILIDVVGTFVAEDLTPSGTISAVETVKAFGYRPDSGSTQTASVYQWAGSASGDCKMISAKTCVGSLSISVDSGGLGKASLEILGSEDSDNMSDRVLPTTTYLDVRPPAFMGSQFLLTPEGGSPYTPKNASVEFNQGNALANENDSVSDTGINSGFIANRPDVGGTLVIQEELNSVFNPKDLQTSSTTVKGGFRIGDGTATRTIYFRMNTNFGESPVTSDNNIRSNSIAYKCIDNTDSDKDYYMIFA